MKVREFPVVTADALAESGDLRAMMFVADVRWAMLIQVRLKLEAPEPGAYLRAVQEGMERYMDIMADACLRRP